MPTNSSEPSSDRITPFLADRFGISFHWGLYSTAARSEWLRSNERLSVEEYQVYFDTFTAERYDPRKWAEIVKRSGARYAVLTAKHHDGFCLWDTATTDYKSTKTPAGRDLIREYVDAMREAGIKVGLYFSLVDWYHPDYPHFADRQHPMRFDESWKGYPHDWSRYVEYMHSQLLELLTQYGEINQLVLDFPYWNFTGEEWGATEIVAMIRKHQPGCVFNDRLGGDIKGHPLSWVGDYDSPELNVPKAPPRNAAGNLVPFETWMPLTNSWCTSTLDQNRKRPEDVVRALVNCVSKGGNLLLNVGPTGFGEIDAACAEVLSQVGDWLETNGESIFGCGAAEFDKPEWGRWTQRGNTLYAHLLEQPIGHVNLPGLLGKVKNARILKTGAEGILCEFWNFPVQTLDDPDDQFMSIGKPVMGTYPLPDRIDTVIRMELCTSDETAERLRAHEAAKDQLQQRIPFN